MDSYQKLMLAMIKEAILTVNKYMKYTNIETGATSIINNKIETANAITKRNRRLKQIRTEYKETMEFIKSDFCEQICGLLDLPYNRLISFIDKQH
jgi:sensor histidine kinase regulating citrate/malate metabolism